MNALDTAPYPPASTETREDGAVPAPSLTARYRGLWRGLPRELGFTLATLPVVIVAFVVLVTGLSLGASLVIVWVGVPVLVVTLLAARWFAAIEVRRLEAAGRPAIPRPTRDVRPARPGLVGRALHVLADGRSWLDALHGVVNFVIGTATWCIALVWLVLAVTGPTSIIWQRWSETSYPHPLLLDTLGGIIALITLPLVIHALVLLHDVIARGMLGEWRITALRRDAAASEASRESAVLAEDQSLRRLERDIHDGPQQGLLRIQFDLASASRALESGHPAQPLVDGALQLTKDTLQELRELSRGLAPPLLQDRGLVSAVTALAARSAVPVTTRFALDDEPALTEVERSVYFIVSELLANVAKHASSASASIDLSITLDGERRMLRAEVADDGLGGAADIPGHGLEGIRQRVAGLRGTFTIDSPIGGPSRFVAEIPLR